MLHMICEYRRLKLRRDLGESLDRVELSRLSVNERALGHRDLEAIGGVSSARGRERRSFARNDVAIPAVLEVGGSEQPVTITNLSGGGLVVTPAPALERGELVVVRVSGDAAAGDEIRLTSQAVWRSGTAAGSALGMAFVGMPD